MGVIIISTKDKKTIEIAAENLDFSHDPESTEPLTLRFEVCLKDDNNKIKILSCMCDYMLATGYSCYPIPILDAISSEWGELASRMFDKNRRDRKYQKGNILLASFIPENCKIENRIVFEDSFDIVALVKGFVAAAELFTKDGSRTDYFAFFGNEKCNPDDLEWRRKLAETRMKKFSCRRSDIVDNNCFLFLWDRRESLV